MKQLALIAMLALAVSGLVFADHHENSYKKIATVHDLMEAVVKPNMDKLAEMKKAGGPADAGQWKHSNAYASVIAEMGQLMLLDGRVKDEVWEDGAKKMLEASKATMTASMRKDTAAWMEGLTGMSGGCRTCHKAHKPKK